MNTNGQVVYVVMYYNYNDIELEAVFSTREAAQNWIDTTEIGPYYNRDYYNIIEKELDDA